MVISARPGTEQATLRYLAAARQVHDELRQTLTQVAGYALLLMTSSRSPALAEAALHSAEAAAESAADNIRALQVPHGAEHHHHHLHGASLALGNACKAARVCASPGAVDRERDVLIDMLRGAVEDLRAVSRSIPGFEAVNFGQACCALHATPQAQQPIN